MDEPEIDLEEFLNDVENRAPKVDRNSPIHRENETESDRDKPRRPLIAAIGSLGILGIGCSIIGLLIGPAGISPGRMFLLLGAGLTIGFVLWYWALVANRRKREQHDLRLVCALAVAPCVVLFVVNAVLIGRIQGDYYADTGLEAHLESYLNYGQPYDAKLNKKQPRLSRWKLDGKMIFVDLETREFSDLNFDLPDDLRAENHEEVRYIAHVHWHSVQTGWYDDGDKGLRKDAGIVLYDTTTGESTRAEVLKGKGPPSSKQGDGDRTGKPPSNQKIIALILRSQ